MVDARLKIENYDFSMAMVMLNTIHLSEVLFPSTSIYKNYKAIKYSRFS